jgi:hypothetical protein
MIRPLLAACLLPTLASAMIPLDGTWRIQAESAQLPEKPYAILLKDGDYSCMDCTPAIHVAADGLYHPVSGSAYANQVSVTALSGANLIEVDKLDGRIVASITRTLSADGTSMTVAILDKTLGQGAPMQSSETHVRVAPAPPGMAAISGSWRRARITQMSLNGKLISFSSEGNLLTMRTPRGQFYNASVGGPESLYVGDPGVSTVSLKRIDDRTIEEHDNAGGKPVRVIRYAVGDDVNQMDVTRTDLADGRVTRLKAVRE